MCFGKGGGRRGETFVRELFNGGITNRIYAHVHSVNPSSKCFRVFFPCGGQTTQAEGYATRVHCTSTCSTKARRFSIFRALIYVGTVKRWRRTENNGRKWRRVYFVRGRQQQNLHLRIRLLSVSVSDARQTPSLEARAAFVCVCVYTLRGWTLGLCSCLLSSFSLSLASLVTSPEDIRGAIVVVVVGLWMWKTNDSGGFGFLNL